MRRGLVEKGTESGHAHLLERERRQRRGRVVEWVRGHGGGAARQRRHQLLQHREHEVGHLLFCARGGTEGARRRSQGCCVGGGVACRMRFAQGPCGDKRIGGANGARRTALLALLEELHSLLEHLVGDALREGKGGHATVMDAAPHPGGLPEGGRRRAPLRSGLGRAAARPPTATTTPLAAAAASAPHCGRTLKVRWEGAAVSSCSETRTSSRLKAEGVEGPGAAKTRSLSRLMAE